MASANPEQLKAIEHQGGVLLKAGAGSGKTFVLQQHMIYLTGEWIKEYKASGQFSEFTQFIKSKFSKVVLMTFTKKAAGEISIRLSKVFKEKTDNCSEEDKEIWEMAGGFNESLGFSEDWDLWFRFGKLGKFYNFQEYFTCYLQGEQNISNLNVRRNLKLNIKLRKKYRHDYPNFWKAFFLGWAYYFYTFLPFWQFGRPMFSKMRRIFFGQPVYKVLKGKK